MSKANLPREPLSPDKQLAFEAAKTLLKQHELDYTITDDQRPWGFFLYVAEDQTARFIDSFYKNVDLGNLDLSLPLQPKILGIAPGKRLSWQYHHRRSEIWRSLGGSFDIVLSDTDRQTTPRAVRQGETVFIPQGTRHRGIGGNSWSVVAEIWQHTDPANPSDENDIVRLADDFGR